MYLNTLICLEENVTGYGKNGAKATGHITITSPGIVKCYVQNLRQLPKEYTVYLISKNQNKAVRLGCINVCEENKQTTWKVDLNNLKGTGLKGTDIDSAAVIVEGDSIGNTDTVLIGYTQGKYLITSMLESALPKKSAPATPKPVSKPEVKVQPATEVVMPNPVGGPGPVIVPKPAGGPGPVIVPKPEEAPCHVIFPMPEGGPGPVIVPKPEGGPGPVIVPMPGEGPGPVIIPKPGEACTEKDECECKVYVPISEDGDATEVEILRGLQTAFARTPNKEDLASRVERIIKESVSPINVSKQMRPLVNRVDKEEEQYLNQIENVLKSIQNNIGEDLKEKKTSLEDEASDYKRDIIRVRDIFNDSTAIEPFEEKDSHIDWVRISMAELISMPQFSYEWCTNPVITYCYHKFGFLILGKDKQIEQYYIGIPDIYDTKRKFILSIDKIEAFRGRNNEDLKPGDYGYWIVRI